MMEEYEDFTKLILESLENKQRDYCFNRKELNSIIEEAKKEGISFLYTICYNKYDKEIDYIEIIPAEFFNKKTNKKIKKPLFLEKNDIDSNIFYNLLDISNYKIKKRYGLEGPKEKKIKKEWNNFNLNGVVRF